MVPLGLEIMVAMDGDLKCTLQPIPDLILMGADPLEEGGKPSCIQTSFHLTGLSPDHEGNQLYEFSHVYGKKRKLLKTIWFIQSGNFLKSKFLCLTTGRSGTQWCKNSISDLRLVSIIR